MTTLREAAQQALEALETLGYPLAAITALRAALAQPLPDPVDEYRKGFIAGQIDMRDRPEEQEPVAWMAPNGDLRKDRKPRKFSDWGWRQEDYVPLYTTPPRREWQSLSEEEIDAIDKSLPRGMLLAAGKKEFARAIEAKLKEKNNE
jgi:hypothetical protein